MTIPSPQTLHQYAREVVRSHARDIERMSVGEMMGDDRRFTGLTEEEFDEAQEAVYRYARIYAAAISWPVEFVADDEQREQTWPPELREVTQSLLSGNEHGFPGDCIRASVASLLDLDPAKVPHFISEDDVRVWPLALKAFAREHGWDIERREFQEDDPLPDFGIAIGTTTRPAASHAVVIRGGEMVWDPHPSRDGLVEVKQVIEFTRAEPLEQVRDRLRTLQPELKAQLVARSSPQTDAVAPEAEQRPGHGPGVPGAMHLEAFGQAVADAFGDCPYHVGSSLTSKKWRDVDVRLILDDDRFAALFPGFAAAHHIDAWWSLFCAAMSELGRARTGLPIDFQVQSMTEANEKYRGPRNPLFLIRARDEDRPRMDARDYGEEFAALLRSGASVSQEDRAALAEVLHEVEDDVCSICGVQPGGNHKFECANAPEPRRLSDGDGPIKRTPEYWCAKYGVEVYDPDGWRHRYALPWDEPITLQDFYERAGRSTTNAVPIDWGRIARDAQEEQ